MAINCNISVNIVEAITHCESDSHWKWVAVDISQKGNNADSARQMSHSEGKTSVPDGNEEFEAAYVACGKNFAC